MQKIIFITVILALLLCGCSKKEPITFEPSVPEETSVPAFVETTPVPTPTPSPTPEPTPTPYDGPLNPLTGMPCEEDYTERRPIAIMLNNIKEALPIYGVSKADIIYETLAEGGITRLLGVYTDTYDVPRIGSVRSSRDYFLDLAQGLDAVYVHAGGSPQAYSAIKARKIDNLDGVAQNYPFFYRDSDRKSAGYSSEHTLFIHGEALAQYAADKVRSEIKNPIAIKFREEPDSFKGDAAMKISVKFSDYKTGVFDYDSATGKYKVSEYGKPFKDGEDGSQLTVTNVLVLEAAVANIKGDDKGRISVTLTGSGKGWYAANGQYIPIEWSKKSYTDPFVYTLDDGSELAFNPGTTYINIVSKGSKVTFE